MVKKKKNTKIRSGGSLILCTDALQNVIRREQSPRSVNHARTVSFLECFFPRTCVEPISRRLSELAKTRHEGNLPSSFSSFSVRGKMIIFFSLLLSIFHVTSSLDSGLLFLNLISQIIILNLFILSLNF